MRSPEWALWRACLCIEPQQARRVKIHSPRIASAQQARCACEADWRPTGIYWLIICSVFLFAVGNSFQNNINVVQVRITSRVFKKRNTLLQYGELYEIAELFVIQRDPYKSQLNRNTPQKKSTTENRLCSTGNRRQFRRRRKTMWSWQS